jgi:hypothetical protein
MNRSQILTVQHVWNIFYFRARQRIPLGLLSEELTEEDAIANIVIKKFSKLQLGFVSGAVSLV